MNDYEPKTDEREAFPVFDNGTTIMVSINGEPPVPARIQTDIHGIVNLETGTVTVESVPTVELEIVP